MQPKVGDKLYHGAPEERVEILHTSSVGLQAILDIPPPCRVVVGEPVPLGLAWRGGEVESGCQPRQHMIWMGWYGRA